MSQQTPKDDTVSLKCKNPKCPSITAKEIPYQTGTRLYRCVKCNHTWAVPVGGKLNINQL